MNAVAAPSTSPPPRRRWLRRVGVVGVVATGLFAAALFWLLATAGGRDTLLFRIVALLPPGTLSWERADGVVSGPLELYGVRYRQADGLELRIDHMLLDPDLLPVLGRRLQLDRLEIAGATLQLAPAADEPFALPSWPGSLPRLPMPIDLRTTTLAIDGLRVRRDEDLLIDIGRFDATGVHLVDDGFAVESATLASDRGDLTLRGEYRPRRDFRSALAATLSLPARADGTAPTLRLAARGDLDALTVDVTGTAPDALSLQFALQDGAGEAPTWTLRAHSAGFDPALFAAGAATADDTGGVPWRFELDAAGVAGAATLHGEIAQGDWQATIQPSQLELADGRLRAAPLALTLPQGPLQVTGVLQVEGDSGRFDVTARSDGLHLVPAAEADAEPVDLRGDLRVFGEFAEWTLEAEAIARRAGAEATLQAHGRGDRERLQVDSLHAVTPTGTLDGQGHWRWSPGSGFALDARLAGFDPGYFLADFPGALQAAIALQGTQDVGGRWRGTARVDELGGQLRGRPVGGHARVDWDGANGDGEADLRIGDSVLRGAGRFGANYDLQVQATPLQLQDLLPQAQGRLEGRLVLRGPAAAADIEADLRGQGIAWGEYRAQSLAVVGTLPARGTGGRFDLQADAPSVPGLELDRLALAGSGSRENLRLQGDAAGASGQATFAGELASAPAGWRGRIDTLRLAPATGPALSLEAPAAFAESAAGWQLDRACLAVVGAGGRVCAAATGHRIELDGEALPLALLQPWLPADTGVAMQPYGTLTLQARLQRDGVLWSGNASLDSAEGGLRLADDLEREVFGYRTLAVRLTLAGDAVDGTLQAQLAEGGSVAAQLHGGRSDAAALAGGLTLDVRDLTWLELFSEDIAAPVGELRGTLVLAGTRAAPALSGSARLDGFAAELPGLGLKLHDGGFDLVGAADGSIRVNGQVTSGAGVLHLDGSLDATDADEPLVLTLKGDDVTLASTAELYAVADPDLTLRWLTDRLEVRGTLLVPEARVDLEALDSDVATSPDVVVVDPVDGNQERGKPLDLEFAVTLGDEVKLKGFGLDGRIAGTLSLRERPGKRATASGTLDVTGRYRAYGQALDIRHARLGYADSPYDDPTLDIRAERRFDRAIVGVQVRGTARRPQTTVVSVPAMDTSEALSWLVFGRPLTTTTSGESQQLGAAAVALGAGGNLIAQQLGARLGFDEAGVVDSRNLGGAAFTVGKYVSPRLFLSYGVSLIGTGQVVTLKYLLTRDFDISIESGQEDAASINWRKEK